MIATEHLVKIDNKLYFKSRYIPGTFYYDLGYKTTKFIAENNNLKPDFGQLDYYWAVKYKDNVVFPPFLGGKFTIYNVKEDKFIYLDKQSKYVYTSYKVLNEKCYFFTYNPNETTILEEKDGEFYLTYPYEFTNVNATVKMNSCDEGCCVGDVIVFASANPNEFVVYDISEGRFNIVNIDIDEMVAHTVHFDGNYFWITGNKPIVYVLDKDLKTVIRRMKLPEEYDKKSSIPWKIYFSMGVIVDNYIFYAPVYYRAVIRVNIVTYEIEIIMSLTNEEYSWGISYVADSCLHINFVKDEKVHWSYFINYNGDIQDEDIFEVSNWKGYFSSYPMLQESKLFSLKWLLSNEW